MWVDDCVVIMVMLIYTVNSVDDVDCSDSAVEEVLVVMADDLHFLRGRVVV